jgi:hypothetical protein
MLSSIAVDRYSRRSRLAREWAGELAGRDEASAGGSVEAIAEEFIQLRDVAQAALTRFLADLFDERAAKDTFLAEDALREAFGHALEAFQIASEFLHRPQQRLPAGLLDDFGAAFSEMRELSRRLDEALPPFSPETTAEAIAEARRGGGEFVEEFLARVQGQDPAGGR